MEPNESHHQDHQRLSSPYYYHHHHHHHHPTTVSASGAVATTTSAAPVPSSNNGIFPPNDGSSLMVYPHSVPSSAVTAPMESAKRKRGRPRKYGTPEQALAAKKMASSASSLSARERREQAAATAGGTASPNSGSLRKSQLGSVGRTGQSFTPHIVNIAPGEDIAQKVMVFALESKKELCVLSASGTISNASLRHPATSEGIVSCEGQYEIVSLCGSFVRTEMGSKTGGLRVCLSSSDGQIIGGVVGGHLKAAGPVQVILGTFQLDGKKDVSSSSGLKGDASSNGSRLPSPAGNTMLDIGFQSGMESSGRHSIRGNEEHHQTSMRGNEEHHQTPMSGSHFMMQTPPQGIHIAHSRPLEWCSNVNDGRSSASYDLSGKAHDFLHLDK